MNRCNLTRLATSLFLLHYTTFTAAASSQNPTQSTAVSHPDVLPFNPDKLISALFSYQESPSVTNPLHYYKVFHKKELV